MEGEVQEPGQLSQIIERVGEAIEVVGVAVIVLGLIMATFVFFRHRQYSPTPEDSYTRYRQDIGRALLLGLEILVAGDIIRTVAVDPTLTSVAVLAGIVLIRTFLSWSLEVEIEGRWPWQQRQERPRGVYAQPEAEQRQPPERQ
jgi:uncharacterized membrane protein